MFSPDFLQMLRCPLNPSRVRLILDQDHFRCEQCATRFQIRDGFPILVAEEAELPAGCECVADLPCQKDAK